MKTNKEKTMKEEYIYCHQLWVASVIWRLECQESGFGSIRGLTVEEYRKLKPAVEKLTVDDFCITKKPRLHLTGPTKEEIQKQITYLKERFKDLEAHPQKLGKTMKDVTYKSEDWWRPAKPGDKKPFFGCESLLGRMWDMPVGLTYVNPDVRGPSEPRMLWNILSQPKMEVDDEKLMENAVGVFAKINE